MTLQEFDDAYTAPAGGFADRHDYYARCSAKPHLHKIARPTVILHAADDPFIDVKDLQDAVLSPSVHLHLTRFGGHMGYLSTNLPDRAYLDYALGHYLDELLQR
jgi:predicted alpha/beta-fold hydrolase